jgi:hypothetical protein
VIAIAARTELPATARFSERIELGVKLVETDMSALSPPTPSQPSHAHDPLDDPLQTVGLC